VFRLIRVWLAFRHTFKDACRDAGLSDEVHDRLTGHATENVGGSYGTGHSLVALNEAIRKVRFPSVPVKRLKRP